MADSYFFRLYSDTVPLMADDLRQAESEDPKYMYHKALDKAMYIERVLMKSIAKWLSLTSWSFVLLNGLHS